MNPAEFKLKWIQNESDRWTEFDSCELEKSEINESTNEFLKIGFPEDAAPYLGFGLRSYDWKFNNILDYYEYDDLDPTTKFYWILGSDNSGNPICIDTSQNDRIILLDHEQGFEIIGTVNKNISELASFLLIYRNFIEEINSKYGEDGFFDSKFTKIDLNELEEKFKSLNSDYYLESSFWDIEIENLRAEIQ
ncbi:SUKH-4 immunity protein [Aquimarina amphilecti]|uniref:SUKH-4 immunity protein n=1 Tax=Aquimarina amphilecti TaxID=1038014 RepID=A0A1H7R0V4_AQUAM|nr:SUKH-4 family immunity protein [Aquimarina amphilecti]SEL53545.1 SUKH-4 immunity protein [Aquimarina amphilecti]